MTLPATYILRRVLIALPSLLGISVVLFTVLALAPGDPFGEIVSNPNIPAEVAANLRQKFGMDDPLAVRYLRWLAAMLQGDWGFSFASRINVDDLIMQRLPTTLLVIGSSQLLAILVALPVGVYAATRPYSLFDQVAGTLTFIGFSLPTFVTGLLLIRAILANDTPVIMAVTFVFSCLVIVFNLIADILYGWLDPRISLR